MDSGRQSYTARYRSALSVSFASQRIQSVPESQKLNAALEWGDDGRGLDPASVRRKGIGTETRAGEDPSGASSPLCWGAPRPQNHYACGACGRG